MNRTIWSGRISRGYLVLPLAEGTIDLQFRSSCSGLHQVSVYKDRFCSLFGQSFQFLDVPWISSSVTQALQEDPLNGCRDLGGSCSLKLPSIHWALSQLGVVLFLVQDFIKFPSAHPSSRALRRWPFDPDGSPRWNRTGPSGAASTTPMATTPQLAREGELAAGSGLSRDCLKPATWRETLGSTLVVSLVPTSN